MSDSADKVMSTIEDIGRRIEKILIRSAGNPQLLGLELISLGSLMKVINVDFIVWDFSGNHVPPITALNAPADPTKPASPSNPTIGQKIANNFWTNFLTATPGISELAQAFGVNTSGNVAAEVTTGNAGAIQFPNTGTIVGQILKDLGIPSQIYFSEVLIIGGFLLMAEPLIAAMAGPLQKALLPAAASAIALG